MYNVPLGEAERACDQEADRGRKCRMSPLGEAQEADRGENVDVP